MYPHRIRLHGPWQYEVIEPAVPKTPNGRPPGGRVQVPGDWSATLGTAFRGCVRYQRDFGRPTGIEQHERVWLVVEGLDPHGTATLNGRELGGIHGYAQQASFDVTELLGDRNRLQLDILLPAEPPPRPGREAMAGGPIGEIRLEIRRRWHIDCLAVWAGTDDGHDCLYASGCVGGTGEPLGDKGLAIVLAAGQREIVFHYVGAELSFEAQQEFPEVPSWPPAAGWRPLDVEIKLLAGGVRVWQAHRPTGLVSARWDAGRQVLSIGQAEARPPWPVCNWPDVLHPDGRIELPPAGQPPEPPIFLRAICPDPFYWQCDAAAQPIVQYIPSAWGTGVCAALAHHPCIVAWSSHWRAASRPSPTHGRPWIEAPLASGRDA